MALSNRKRQEPHSMVCAFLILDGIENPNACYEPVIELWCPLAWWNLHFTMWGPMCEENLLVGLGQGFAFSPRRFRVQAVSHVCAPLVWMRSIRVLDARGLSSHRFWSTLLKLGGNWRTGSRMHALPFDSRLLTLYAALENREHVRCEAACRYLQLKLAVP